MEPRASGVPVEDPSILGSSRFVSADHRKPFLAFIALAVLAAAIVGVQGAEARPGRFLAAAIGAGATVHGTLMISADHDVAVGDEHTLRGLPGHVWHEGRVDRGLEPAGRSHSAKHEPGAGAAKRSLDAVRESVVRAARAAARKDRKVVERAAAAARGAAAAARNGHVLGGLLRHAPRHGR